MKRNLFTQNPSPEFKDLLDEINICIFTTSDQQKKKNSSGIMSNARVDDNGTIWFFSNKKAKRITEINDYSSVHLLYTHPSKKHYVDVWGTATVLEDRAIMKELWNPVVTALFPAGMGKSDLCLIKIEPVKAHYWDTLTNHSVGFFKSLSSPEIIKEGLPSVA